jgi:hypothetical protein
MPSMQQALPDDLRAMQVQGTTRRARTRVMGPHRGIALDLRVTSA